MKQKQAHKPPRWATRLLALYCRPEIVEDLEGDLNEYFARNVQSKGARRARLIYIIDVLKFCRLYTLRRPRHINPLIQWIMIGSYFKTAQRTMVRNKLFSFINIAGLAVSMSVGLLMIAFVTDLRSYDDFHRNKDRIYRLTTSDHREGQKTMSLASTSVLAGKEVSSSVTGVESLTLMRNDFGGDVIVDDDLITVRGLWADQKFFSIFTFPTVEGNPATALKDPYSVVLTETTARKIFGQRTALGKSVRVGKDDYIVTAVLKDLPSQSHLRFDALGSFSTMEMKHPNTDGEFMDWGSIYMNYVYLLLPEGRSPESVQAGISKLCAAENATLKDRKIELSLQPLKAIAINTHLENEVGPVMHIAVVWILSGLAFVVILCACFNYMNLSVARALRRSREVGIRKIVGAYKRQVLAQFVIEALLVALLALVFSFLLFTFLRTKFIELSPQLQRLVSLQLSPRIVLYFIVLALVTGLIAGIFPALLFSRLQAVQALKDASSVRLFRHVNLRKALIVVQYVFSIAFITATTVGYKQYKSFLVFDLGFNTENVININLKGNNAKLLANELASVPAVVDVSRSVMVTSLGSKFGTSVKYKGQQDGQDAFMNVVDDRYLSVHGHALLAGSNFTWRPDSVEESEVIVNEQLVKQFNIAEGDIQKAVGEELVVADKKLTIVGVLKDFHYGTVDDAIKPTLLIYRPRENYGHLNVKVMAGDVTATMAGIEAAWKKIDKLHPMDARFYNDQIEEAYNQFQIMIKVIGFLAFLAICIASLGLFGMVVFTTETRVREVSIRKVLGASEGSLVIALGRSFIVLLLVASAIALPATWLFFENVVLSRFAYRQPIGWSEMLTGVGCIMVLALVMIGSQTLRVARVNPADTLKSE